ncbi:MAG: mechanosensitive ion channel family protein, partial [Gammaproteobacteria bacterium]
LKQIMDGKALYVRLEEIPDKPDYIDTLTGKTIYKLFPAQLPDVFLRKIDGKWYYSPETVAAIPALHKEVYPWGTDALIKWLPVERQGSFLGLQAWQWIGLVILIFLTLASFFVVSRVMRPVVRFAARSRYSNLLEDKGKLFVIANRSALLVVGWGLMKLLPALQLPIVVMVWLMRGIEIALVVLLAMLLFSILEIIRIYAFRYALSTENKLDEQLLPILYRSAQIIVGVGAIIYILSLLEVNVTALIAGVSIGGLALALAAQDTVKNLIGSAMIFFDKPFQIGDWIVMSGIEGEVVEVGFRSTRVQTVDSSIVSIPNNEISTSAITNMGVRRYRMFKAMLGVTYDTPPALLEAFVDGLRQLIELHPLTKKDNYLVYFHSFGDSSLNIYFRTHLGVATFKEELQEREKLALGILELANKLGVRFAFPTQTIFVEEFPGNGNTTPNYDIDPANMEAKTKEQLEKWK